MANLYRSTRRFLGDDRYCRPLSCGKAGAVVWGSCRVPGMPLSDEPLSCGKAGAVVWGSCRVPGMPLSDERAANDIALSHERGDNVRRFIMRGPVVLASFL